MSPEYKCKIPTRLRFMMQDIVELKENDWVPRNSRPKPPTSNTTAQSYAKNPRVPLAPVSTVKVHKLFSYNINCPLALHR